MRWSQGAWSEHRVSEAINASNEFYSVPYGISGVAPDDPEEYEIYFAKLDAADLGKLKRPDLLIFPKSQQAQVDAFVESVGGITELPFKLEEDLAPLLDMALLAIECENSLWAAKKMPDFSRTLTPQKWLNGKPGVKKSAIMPNIWLKNEDKAPLEAWQASTRVPIHIWQIFFDCAYGIALNEANRLIAEELILREDHTFHAASGSTVTKTVYKIYHLYAYSISETASEPSLVADYIQDKNGHILPYVRFEGGSLFLTNSALEVLRAAKPRTPEAP